MHKLADYESLQYQKISITGHAVEDATYGRTSQLTFGLTDLVLENGQKLSGVVQVSGFGEKAVFQGDSLQVTGKLYPGYGAEQGRISFAEFNRLSPGKSLIAHIRRSFGAGIQTAIPDPMASFAMGILIGQRATLPDNTKDDLKRVGLTHIIAVSGYNLTIILQASKQILSKRSKRIATILSFALMGVFLLLAGSCASIVRAAIVSMLSITAGYYGRTFKPVLLITFAAVITALAKPFYVWSDLSWYLSFLAFFGVMMVAPMFAERLRPSVREVTIVMVLLESLAAEIVTLPFMLYMFGQMSLVNLLSNVLITTLVPLAMLLSAIAGLGGMLVSGAVGWVAWPATYLLTYMLDTAHVLAHLPNIFLQDLKLSMNKMIFLYGLVLTMVWLMGRKTKFAEAGKITDRAKVKIRGIGT